MRKKDLNTLWNFILRTPMFIGSEDSGKIMSFLHGYEMGTENQCSFIERLSNSIYAEYGIKPSNTRLHGQISSLAIKSNTDWVITFKRQGLKELHKEIDEIESIAFYDLVKKRIIAKAKILNIHFNKEWIWDWYGLCDISAEWFKKIWSKKELEILDDIDSELSIYVTIPKIPDNIEPTESLKLLATKLLAELNQ